MLAHFFNKHKVNSFGFFGVCFLFLLLFFSCKTKQTASDQNQLVSSHSSADIMTGTVSHLFKARGCGTIILCKKDSDTLFLIPMNSLGAFDVDGLELTFTYRILRVHNPKGCKGMPVEISDMERKRHLK